MASPEVVVPSGILVPTFHEEPLALEGWKKKLILKEGGTPKKDVIFVSPDGEEIRNKRQLEKYLKDHAGGPSVADFDWSTGETPRRSARLSNKGRLSSDSVELEPAFKRSKWDLEEDPVIVVSPRKSSRRKSRSQVASTGKDVVMEDTEKMDEGKRASAEGLIADSDANLAVEKALPRDDQLPVNNTDGKRNEEEIAATIEEINRGEFAEQVPPTEELRSAGNSADQVEPEGQALKTGELFIVTDNVMVEGIEVEVAAVEAVTGVGELVPLEQPAETSIALPVVEEVLQLTEGETSLKQDEDSKEDVSEDILDVPATAQLDGTVDDPVELREVVESQGIHALIEEPVIKPSEQQTKRPLAAAERVGAST